MSGNAGKEKVTTSTLVLHEMAMLTKTKQTDTFLVGVHKIVDTSVHFVLLSTMS